MDNDYNKISSVADNVATPHCFLLVKRSLLAAEIQVSRIWERPISVSGDSLLQYEIKLIDVHFYFIALRNVYRHLSKVVSDPAYVHLKPKLEDLNQKWFKRYAQGREAFEHIDQRFPGEKHEGQIVEIEEQGACRKINYGLSMKKGLFKHSDKTWDISVRSFEAIKFDVKFLMGQIVDLSKDKQG